MKITQKLNKIWEDTHKPALIVSNTSWLIYWSITYNQEIDLIQNYIQSYIIYIVSYQITKKIL